MIKQPCPHPLSPQSASLQPATIAPNIAALLLDWYDQHHRILPWRITPAQQAQGMRADPYRIWLSEIMLQQTTVEAVKAYFLKFTTQWPDIQALAGASEEDVLRGWAGLGYYSRARNLKKCANLIADAFNGQFPATVEQLRQLPGIGDYTAAAIAAIAFGLPATVVDGNVERVVSRLFTVATPMPKARPEIRALTAQITPAKRAGDFAQAMMDLGAGICTPKNPGCSRCPLQQHCRAYQHNEPALYPVKLPKKPRPVRYGAAFIIQSPDQQIYLRKRGDQGLLAGMSEVPNSPWVAVDTNSTSAEIEDLTGTGEAPMQAQWQLRGSISHIFTHFELRLQVYSTQVAAMAPSNNGWWVALDQLEHEALPTVMKKAIAVVFPDLFTSIPAPRTSKKDAGKKPAP